jgi:hypothetical protein
MLSTELGLTGAAAIVPICLVMPETSQEQIWKKNLNNAMTSLTLGVKK